VSEVHRLGDAEQLARRHVADHRLLTLGRGLLDPEMPVQQHEEAVGFEPLLEHGRALRIANRPRLAQQIVLLAGG
jgi:hypothetical protein